MGGEREKVGVGEEGGNKKKRERKRRRKIPEEEGTTEDEHDNNDDNEEEETEEDEWKQKRHKHFLIHRKCIFHGSQDPNRQLVLVYHPVKKVALSLQNPSVFTSVTSHLKLEKEDKTRVQQAVRAGAKEEVDAECLSSAPRSLSILQISFNTSVLPLMQVDTNGVYGATFFLITGLSLVWSDFLKMWNNTSHVSQDIYLGK